MITNISGTCTTSGARRLHYEQCASGLRIVHETHGPGVVVDTSAQLVRIRPDGGDHNLLAFAAQLWPERSGFLQ